MQNELLNEINEEGMDTVVEVTKNNNIITKIGIGLVIVAIGAGVGYYLRKKKLNKVKDADVVDEVKDEDK